MLQTVPGGCRVPIKDLGPPCKILPVRPTCALKTTRGRAVQRRKLSSFQLSSVNRCEPESHVFQSRLFRRLCAVSQLAARPPRPALGCSGWESVTLPFSWASAGVSARGSVRRPGGQERKTGHALNGVSTVPVGATPAMAPHPPSSS